MSLARNKKNKGKKLGIVVLSTPPYSCQHQRIHKTINIKYRTCRFILGKALHWVSVVCFWQSYFFGWDLGRCQYAKNAASLLFLWPQHPKWFFSSCPVYIVIPVSWVHLIALFTFKVTFEQNLSFGWLIYPTYSWPLDDFFNANILVSCFSIRTENALKLVLLISSYL